MSIIVLENNIRSYYGLHWKQRIFNIDQDKMEFEILLGSSILTLPMPPKMIRSLKIKKILK